MQLCISDRWCQPTYAFSSRNDGHCMLLCRPKAAGPCSTNISCMQHHPGTINCNPSPANPARASFFIIFLFPLLSRCLIRSVTVYVCVSMQTHTHTHESPQLFAVAHLPAVPAASANRGCTQPIHCMVYKDRADNIYYVIFFMPR